MRTTFLAALPSVRPLLASAETGRRWKEPSALAGLTVGGLSGHLYRALLTVDAYLDRPPPNGEDLVSAAAYFHRLLDADPESEINLSVRARGEQLGALGQDAVLSAFDEMVARLSERLSAEPRGRTVQVAGDLPLTLDEYLRTRLVELAVHADDMAVSVGSEAALPDEVWSEAIAVLLDLARLRRGNAAVLRALARRERAMEDVFPVL